MAKKNNPSKRAKDLKGGQEFRDRQGVDANHYYTVLEAFNTGDEEYGRNLFRELYGRNMDEVDLASFKKDPTITTRATLPMIKIMPGVLSKTPMEQIQGAYGKDRMKGERYQTMKRAYNTTYPDDPIMDVDMERTVSPMNRGLAGGDNPLKKKKAGLDAISGADVPQFAGGGLAGAWDKTKDWTVDNKDYIMGGLQIGAGAALATATFGAAAPLSAGLIAGGVGSISQGISGDVQDRKEAEAADDQIRGMGAIGSTPGVPSFGKGGKFKRMANGGLVEWQGGEPMMTPGGKIVRTPKSAPTHAQGGVTGEVPTGTAFLGSMKNPETGNKFMEDGDKLGKTQKKAENLLRTSSAKRARNAAILNKQNAIKKFNNLMETQEVIKGPTDAKKMQYGGYEDDIKMSMDSTSNYPYTGNGISYPGYQGYLTWMGQEAKTPTLSQAAGVTPGDYNRGYLSPSHAMRGLNNQMWLDQNYGTIEPTASDYGIQTPNINDIANEGSFNPRVINPVEQTGGQSVQNPTRPLPRIGGMNDIGADNLTPTQRRQLAMNILNRSMSFYDMPGRGSGSTNTTGINTTTNPTGNIDLTGSVAGRDLTTGYANDTIDPLASGQGTGVIPSTGRGLSFGQKAGDFINGNGAALASLAPVAFDAIGAMIPQERERLPSQYNKANALLANRRFNVRPLLQANRDAAAISRYNAKALGGGRGESARAVGTAGRMAADMEAYGLKDRMDNQYRAEQAQGLFGTGQAQREVDVANVQNEAARRNMLRSSISGLSRYAQNRELMNNMSERDMQRMQILERTYPFYNKWYGDIDFN